MKRLKFLETKRTPRYSMRKLNVGMASVLLGVTIFGINFTNHSVKAATMESVKTSNSSPNSNSQQTLAAVLTTAERTNTQKATSATEKVQQGSASKNATANNSTEAATTPQSSPETQGSADTDINSSAAKLAATVDQNNINTQKATSATEKVRQGSASKNATANNSTEAATTSQSAPKTQSSADTDIRSLDIRSLTAISAAKLSTMNLMQTNGINGTDTDGNAAAKLSTMNLLAMNLMKASGTDTDTGNVADLQDSLRTTAEEKGVATNHQGTPQGQDTTQNTTNEKGITPNVWAARLLAALVVNPTSTDPKEAPTSLPMSNQDIKLDSQPMLTEITNKPTDNWVYNNLKRYWIKSTATVKGILQTHTTNDESGRYYFAGVANYNESFHVIYLLARSNNLNDNNLYVTILHTGMDQNTQEAVVAPGESKPVEYGRTDHTPIFTNYDGTSVSIGLDGIEKGDDIQGMVVGFAYGKDTGISGDPASMGNGFMTTPMPTKVTTTIHYVDQATGDELAVPKSFEGVAYQKYTITGEAPTIDGYTLKKSPNTTGSISPYKVGESYDFRLDKHVVVKQTVIDSQGLVRITAYYDGEELNNTTRYLGNMKNVNDHFSFGSHGKWYTYTNQITSTNDGIVYYYAKDGSEDKSEVRVHYIDVTGNKSSLFVPGDGKEVATDKISGKLGENYNYNVNLPTDYNLATNQANTVNGTYTIDHHDEYVYVVKKTSAEKTKPKVPSTKEPVANTSSLTETEKANVQKNVEDANKDENGKSTLPEGTTVTVGDDGTATIKYKDGSKDTIPGSDLVRPATKVPSTKEPVANTSSLTETEKANVQKNVEDANKDENGKSTLPEGTTVTVGDDGTATIKYKDGSKDTIPGSDLVRPATKVPSTKEPVANTSSLTETEKTNVQKNVEDANKDENGKSTLPEGTTVTVGDDGTATIKYKDGSKDTIPGSDLVRPATKVPSTKEPVANTSSLTETEKANVQKNVEDANKDENGKSTLPEGTTVTVGDDGTATIKYKDGSKDTIPGSDLVRPATKVPSTKEPVANTSSLTETEKANVQKNVEDANKDENGKSTLPEGTTVTVGDDGTATIKYKDGSKDTIPGSDLVRPATKVPSTKEPVANTSSLTETEKANVQKNVEDANKDENGKSTLPEGTTVTVGDDGTATIKYPDGSKDTIPGDQLVQGQKGDTTDAGNITPTIPGGKVTVKDPSHLTDDEKNQVKDNVDNANKDKFPEGTEVTVGDDGTATIKYPDGSKDTIPGDQLVQGQKGDTTDAGNITPTIPGGKVTVKDPSHLTDDEKNQVKDNVDNANKDKFPAGTEVTVGDDGTTTVTYPDGSKDVIAGTDLVIAAKGEDVLGSKYHSHKNGSNSSQADRVKGASTANGSIANAGNNLGVKAESDNAFVGVKAESDNAFVGVKGESDNAIGNNKATSLKTLPQTGTKDTSILGVLGMLLASLGLFVFKKKRDKE